MVLIQIPSGPSPSPTPTLTLIPIARAPKGDKGDSSDKVRQKWKKRAYSTPVLTFARRTGNQMEIVQFVLHFYQGIVSLTTLI